MDLKQKQDVLNLKIVLHKTQQMDWMKMEMNSLSVNGAYKRLCLQK